MAVPTSLGRIAIALLLTLFAADGSAGQALHAGDPELDYLRTLQLLGRADPGSLSLLPTKPAGGVGALARGAHPWSARYPSEPAVRDGRVSLRARGATLRTYINTSYPVGQNDGAVWQGKGHTTTLSAGADASWRGLSVTFAPMLIYTQNASFELAPSVPAGMPPYAYPWRRIDMPVRFGPDPFWKFDLGRSEIGLSGFGLRASVGTMNRWWGPSTRNAIVMSNNAPGFMHVALGTDGAVDLRVAELEAQWIWGDLDKTEWFLPSLADKDRFITGVMAVLRPSFARGLSFGMTRVFYGWKPEGGHELGDYFLIFQGVRKEYFSTPDNPDGDDEHDQMLSLFGRWVVEGAKFEIYGEWARNDHSWNYRDLILDPGHSAGVTVGMQKAMEVSGLVVALRAELTNLDGTTEILRAVPTYYAHHVVLEGYTNEGQVIGAGIGPGGNSQHFAADLYAPWGRAGIFVQRDVRDNDGFYEWAVANNATRWERNVLLHGGANALVFVGDFDLGAGLTLTRELNRYFIGRDLWNLNVDLSARWRPR